jgi:hypothetical protein
VREQRFLTTPSGENQVEIKTLYIPVINGSINGSIDGYNGAINGCNWV